MTTIILAAGYGTRLYPLTLDKPKALLEVGGITILDRLIKKIDSIEECDKIFIVTNDKFHEDLEEWAEKSTFTVEIEVINDQTKSNQTRLGAIGDIDLVLKKKDIEDDLLISGSDNLFDFDLREFIKFGVENKPSSSIALFDVKSKEFARKYGICNLDKDSLVINFEEKPFSPKTTLAATALYFIPKEKVSIIFDYMKTDLSKDAPGNLMKWLAKVDKVFGYVLSGAWYDIGDIDSLKIADQEFRMRENI